MARVLIVDDEPTNSGALGSYLAAQGHEIATTMTPEEAVDHARRFHPDVLVTDIVLGAEIDGASLARLLLREQPELRVIVMSGLPEREVRERCLGLRSWAFFSKPLRPRALADSVRAATAGAGVA